MSIFSKLKFDLDVRHVSHKPLAQVIAQALPVFDVKFTFTFTVQSPQQGLKRHGHSQKHDQ